MTEHILTITCPNGPGLVARLANAIYELDGDILESQQFDDAISGRFFMRMLLRAPDRPELSEKLRAVAKTISAEMTLRPAATPRKIVILVSRYTHCLTDLLYRIRIGELNLDVVAVISNHPVEDTDLIGIAADRFHLLPVSKTNRTEQEGEIKRIVTETGAELIVLARYMQILSNDLSSFLAGRCINIHHSFLPGFKGAKPYHQAYDRGVKMVGASAHFVTEDLDEGPIISQGVEAVSHAQSPDDMVRIGRDIERRVLTDAVHCYIEDRILMNGARTVVFRR